MLLLVAAFAAATGSAPGPAPNLRKALPVHGPRGPTFVGHPELADPFRGRRRSSTANPPRFRRVDRAPGELGELVHRHLRPRPSWTRPVLPSLEPGHRRHADRRSPPGLSSRHALCPLQRPVCDFDTPGQGSLTEASCKDQSVALYEYAKWIRPGARVLELGARYGQTTCAISRILDRDKGGDLISMESDPAAWGVLQTNLHRNQCMATVVDAGTPYNSFNLTFDTLAVGCAGCLGPFLDANPAILDKLTMVIADISSPNDPGMQRLLDTGWLDNEVVMSKTGSTPDDGNLDELIAAQYDTNTTSVGNLGVVFCRGECRPSNRACSCCD